MNIKQIRYWEVNKENSTQCSCCGKNIKNIYHIELEDGQAFDVGTTCFEKQIKSKFNKMVVKKVKRALDLIKFQEGNLEYWATVTEEEYKRINPYNYAELFKTDGINNFEDYRNFMLNEFIPYHLEENKKIIKQYGQYL